jgi:sugar/nucleoside kinase (ribokinase family)
VIEALFVGLSTIDVIYNVAEFPAANTKVEARSQEVFVGGPATNAAVAFAALGGRAALVSAVGRHSLGNAVREELRKYQIEHIDLNPEFDGVPALSSVTVDGAGRRNVVSANAARIPIPETVVDQRVCEEANILLVDGHAMQACQAWASAARALRKQVVLDAGSWKQGMDELLRSVDTAICSADFAPPGCRSEEDVVIFLEDHGVPNIAITHGAEPVHFISPEDAGEIKVPSIDVIDTTGAGDIFHGAFCYFHAKGSGFAEALKRAAEVATHSCRYSGTREWLKHLPVGNML